jgi:asparagine synthase (glutamine-hydrolysing)
VNRPKISRPHFLSSWIESHALAEILPLLTKGTLVETGFISEQWLHSQLRTASKRKEGFRHLWAILILEIWFRLFINKPIGLQAPAVSAKTLLYEA